MVLTKNLTLENQCNCTSEILRVVYEDNFFYVDIFDNHALKLKSGIKTSTYFNEKDAPELEKILNNMLNLFEWKSIFYIQADADLRVSENYWWVIISLVRTQ